jgi:hypothetical protein
MVNVVSVKIWCPGGKTGWIKVVTQGIGGEVDGLHTGAKSSNANNVIITQ